MDDRELQAFTLKYDVVQMVEGFSSCWLWRSGFTDDGYGLFYVNGTRLAHRLSYGHYMGDPGPNLDHLCRVRNCVNPEHLEATTHKENVSRRPKSTHCPQGHPYDEANTYTRIDKRTNKPVRRCKVCHNAKRRGRK